MSECKNQITKCNTCNALTKKQDSVAKHHKTTGSNSKVPEPDNKNAGSKRCLNAITKLQVPIA